MEGKDSNRLIFKRGEVNTSKQNVGRCIRRYFKDGFTSFIDAKWRYTILTFVCFYVTSWSLYGTIWYLMALTRGDISYYSNYFAAEDKDAFEKENPYTPCVRNLYSFTSAFLFSVETQHTIGYGFRYVTEECVGGPVLVALQSVFGTLLQCFLMGGIVAKLARPKKRAQNIIFSKHAVICHRDGVPYLMFRVADTRKSYIVQATVKARIIRKKMTREGELINFYQQELPLTTDECDDKIMLMWPTIITHKIDSKSPLYELSSVDLRREQFEIIVMLEGGVESTGLAAQARTSYLPSEIYWGHRFQNLVSYDDGSNEYHMDYNLFDNIIKVEGSPVCSPRQLERMRNFNINITQAFVNEELILKPDEYLNGYNKSIV